MKLVRRFMGCLRRGKAAVMGKIMPSRRLVSKKDVGPQFASDGVFSPPTFASLQLAQDHVKRVLVEPTEKSEVAAALAAVTSHLLMDVHKAQEYPDDVLSKWCSWGGGQAFFNKDAVGIALAPLIEYAESTAAGDVRHKLRYIAKVLSDDPSLDPRDIICFLATHATVCNVMKEVAIRGSYGMLTNSMAASGLSIEENLYNLLAAQRELVLEQVYLEAVVKPLGGDLNTHQLIGYRNAVAKQIGLTEIPDEHTYPNMIAVEHLPQFWKLYNESVLRTVYQALNTYPRRLDYSAAVEWLERNRTSAFSNQSQKTDFLFECFDEDGKFTAGAIAWMLLKMGVYEPAQGARPAQIEAELFAASGSDGATAPLDVTGLVNCSSNGMAVTDAAVGPVPDVNPQPNVPLADAAVGPVPNVNPWQNAPVPLSEDDSAFEMDLLFSEPVVAVEAAVGAVDDDDSESTTEVSSSTEEQEDLTVSKGKGEL